MPVSRTPPGANTYVYVWVCICLYDVSCIYMPIWMYICMYVYVCVCIPFACYNNTIFHCNSMKPWWLSGRYRLIWLGRQVFELQLRQRSFIPVSISFCPEKLPPATSRRTEFLVEPWTASKICMQAHTCKYIHIQSDIYQYMCIYAHTSDTSWYSWIQTYTYIYIHIQVLYAYLLQIHTYTVRYIPIHVYIYAYKWYKTIQVDTDIYIHIHTHTGVICIYVVYMYVYVCMCLYPCCML